MEKEFQHMIGNFAEFLTECFSHPSGHPDDDKHSIEKFLILSWHQRTFFLFMQEPTDHFEEGNSLHEDGTVTTERHT